MRGKKQYSKVTINKMLTLDSYRFHHPLCYFTNSVDFIYLFKFAKPQFSCCQNSYNDHTKFPRLLY